jgi:serine/threonine protein kinase
MRVSALGLQRRWSLRFLLLLQLLVVVVGLLLLLLPAFANSARVLPTRLEQEQKEDQHRSLTVVGAAEEEPEAAKATTTASNVTCPLDFSILNKYTWINQACGPGTNSTSCCYAALSGMGLGIAMYLHNTGEFELPDTATAYACFDAFQAALQKIGVKQDVVKECSSGNSTSTTSNTTMNVAMFTRSTKLCKGILTVNDFRRIVGPSSVDSACVDVATHGQCIECVTAMQSLIQQLGSNNGADDDDGVHECLDFVVLYAAAVVNSAGPWNADTATCILAVGYNPPIENHTGLFVGLGAAIAALIAVAVGLILLVVKRREKVAVHREFVSRNSKLLKQGAAGGGGGAAAALVWYNFADLKAATHGFSENNLVGEGAFGSVYKGVLKDGQRIAVKRFRNCTPDGDHSFLNEVEVIGKVKHRNLVVLRGCCVASTKTDGHQRMLVYDFMQNGSLADCLFSNNNKSSGSKEGSSSNNRCKEKSGGSSSKEESTKPLQLEWEDRYKIAIGMAKGLAYLHSGVVPQIIHRDIKANNILLDVHFNARVADFGLAKLAPEDETHFTTHVAGTHGYVAPEYALYGQLTDKSDVYSFGVCLLELLSSRTALLHPAAASAPPLTTTTAAASESGGGSPTSSSSSPHNLCLITDWAWLLVKEAKGIEVVDPAICDTNDGAHQDVMLRFVKVGILCAHLLVAFRPSMTEALKMLEGDCDIPEIPDRPLPLTFDMLYDNKNQSNAEYSCVSSSHSTTPFLEVLTQQELLR